LASPSGGLRHFVAPGSFDGVGGIGGNPVGEVMSAFVFRSSEVQKPGSGDLIGRSLLFVGQGACANDALQRSLRRAASVAEFAETGAAADRLLPRCHFDCIVVEVSSAGDPALAWIDGLRGGGSSRCICVVAPDDPAVADAARLAGAMAVLRAPLDAKSLQRFLASHASPATDRRAPSGSGSAGTPEALRVHLVGDSAPIRRVRSIVERVAPTSATVLIEGQTGTGKELIARLVHERSGRRGPFVPVNCGAIPPELMETELFGHAKGAFTGAHQQRDGLFVSSRGGTLFLDEISEMRSDLQVKLLRALEESRIRPVGADREVPIDVRIVASAQPGLREQVQQRRFREDLYYRLNVVHILLPGLRERPEDIAPLVQYFMQRVADEFGMTPVTLDETELASLRSRDWPGNVRELRNYIERTLLMGGAPDEEVDGVATTDERATGAYPVEWTLEQVKQAHIERVLAHNQGNRSATARQLGVSRKTLERRLGPGNECS
jgi:DNA-binding NtrC family response regulator